MRGPISGGVRRGLFFGGSPPTASTAGAVQPLGGRRVRTPPCPAGPPLPRRQAQPGLPSGVRSRDADGPAAGWRARQCGWKLRLNLSSSVLTVLTVRGLPRRAPTTLPSWLTAAPPPYMDPPNSRYSGSTAASCGAVCWREPVAELQPQFQGLDHHMALEMRL